jgi:hypothetical protein
MRSFRRAALVGLVALVGCVSGGGEAVQEDPFTDARSAQDVLLTVQNNEFLDANIYALWNGMRQRVGTVTGKTSHTFRMEWRSEFLRLEVEFVGSNDGYTSELIGVSRGDHLDFVIMPRS